MSCSIRFAPDRKICILSCYRISHSGRHGSRGEPEMRPIAVALILTIVSPVSSFAQSDETCVAYMEADAAYEVAEKAARAAGDVACEKAVAPYISACTSARARQSACDEAWTKFTEAKTRRLAICSNYKSVRDGSCANATRQSDSARDTHTAVCEEIRTACGDRADFARREACRNASSAAEKPIIEAAEEAWGRAYGLAYRGPTSNIPSVFQKLVIADRERCQQRGM